MSPSSTCPLRVTAAAALTLVLLGAGIAACNDGPPTGVDPVSAQAALAGGNPAAAKPAPASAHVVTASTGVSAGQWKQHMAQCPTGERATGGGYMVYDDFYLTGLVVSRNQPMYGDNGVPTGWIAKLKPTGANGTLHVFAVCLPG